jgi:hypothetical protein
VWPTQEQTLTHEHTAPGTQLQVQMAPGGIGDPQACVYDAPPLVYWMPLASLELV